MSRVRRATAEDIPMLMSIEKASPTAAHWSEEQYRAGLRAGAVPERVTLVIEEERIIGFLVAGVVEDEWEIENVVVANGERRRGIGSQLVKELLDLARIRSGRSVFLEVRESNQAARRLYESAGFALVGRRKSYYAGPAEDALLFRHSFPQQPSKSVEGPRGVC